MTFQFACSICGKVLQTTSDRVGESAQCPGCGEILIVPNAPEGASAEERPGFTESGRFSEPAPYMVSLKTCPMCGEQIRAEAQKCRYCGEVLTAAVERVKEPLNASRTLIVAWTITRQKFWQILGGIAGSVVSLFGLSLGVYIVSQIVSQIVFLAGAVILLGLTGADLNRLNPVMVFTAIGMGMLFFYVLLYFASIFVLMGLHIYILKLVRGERASLLDLIAGSRFAIRALLNSLVFGLMHSLGNSLCVAPGVYVLTVFFPFLFVLIDQGPPGLDSLWRAERLTRGNRWELFRILVTIVVLSLLCALPLGVGLFLTTQADMGPAPLAVGMLLFLLGVLVIAPLVLVLGAVIYVHLSGQRTAIEILASQT